MAQVLCVAWMAAYSAARRCQIAFWRGLTLLKSEASVLAVSLAFSSYIYPFLTK